MFNYELDSAHERKITSDTMMIDAASIVINFTAAVVSEVARYDHRYIWNMAFGPLQ
jgi:hypothetical protein